MAATTFSLDADFTRVAMLSHTKFVVVYRENSTLEARAKVGSVAGGAVSFGAHAVMDPNPITGLTQDPFAVVALDSGHALAIWSGSAVGAWAAVLTITGTGVTAGPRNQFAPAGEWMAAVRLAAGRVMITFRRFDASPGARWGAALIATVAGSDVTFGPDWPFNTNNTTWISAAALTPARAVIAYSDALSAGRALIADASGTDISFGAPAVFEAGELEAGIAALRLDNARFALAYKSGKGYVKVGAVSGTSIAFAPPQEFYSGSDLYAARLEPLGADQAVLLSRIGDASSNILTDRLVTFSGTAAAFGAPNVCVPDTVDYFDLGAEEDGAAVAVYGLHTPADEGQALQLERYESAVTQPLGRGKFGDDVSYCDVAMLSSTKFIVFFLAADPSVVGGPATARVGTLSGADVTFGDAVVVDAQTVGSYAHSLSVIGLDSTRAVAVWGGISPARAAVLTIVGGTSVTVGPPVDFASDHSADSMNAVYLGAGRVLVAFRDFAGGNSGKAVLATVSGSDITLGAPATFSADVFADLRAAQLSPSKAVIAFTDASARGLALIAAVGAGGAISFGEPNGFQTGEAFAHTSLMKLDEYGENFAVAFTHGKGYIKVGTVSGTGTGITFGEATEFYALTDLGAMCNARLDAGRSALVTQVDIAVGQDKLVTFGVPIVVSPPGFWLAGGYTPEYIAAAALDGENAIVVYRDSHSGDGLAVLRQYEAVTTEPGGPPTVTEPGTPTIAGSNLALCRAAKLSSTKFAVVWRDPGDGNKAKAAVGRLDGIDVRFGTPKVMDPQWSGTGTDTFAVVRLDDTRALALWRRYQPANDEIRACVLTKSGALQVSVGPSTLLFTGVSTNSLQYLEAVLLSEGKVLIAFQNQVSANRLSAVVATVAGDAVAFGAFHELVGPSANLVRAAAISSAKAVIAFGDTASGNDGKAVVATVSGTDVTFGPAATFQTGAQNVGNISVLKLDWVLAGDRFAVVYTGEASNPSDGVVKVGTVSGTGISFGAAQLFSPPNASLKTTRLSLLGPDRMSLVYLDGVEGGDALATASGDAAAFGAPRVWYTSPVAFSAAAIDSVDAVAMDTENVVVVYVDRDTQDITPAVLAYEPGPLFVTDPTPQPPVTIGPPPGGGAVTSPPNPPPATTTTTAPPAPVTKWEQPPDETADGVDVRACSLPGGGSPVVLADDWLCEQRGELAGVWLWCSYLADQLPTTTPPPSTTTLPPGSPPPFLALRLSIHAGVQLGPNGHPCPGDLLWEHYFTPGVDCAVTPHATVPSGEWFWDPSSMDPPTPAADQLIFRIDCDMTAPGVPPFVQEGDPLAPRVYWLDVQAFLPADAPAVRFGWKTAAPPSTTTAPSTTAPSTSTTAPSTTTTAPSTSTTAPSTTTTAPSTTTAPPATTTTVPPPAVAAAVFAAVDAPAPVDWHAMAYPSPHPDAAAPVNMAFGVSFRSSSAPATTTAPPAPTTQPPATTPPPATTQPPATTAPQIQHPADTNLDWMCQPIEVLAWAYTWLSGGTLSFLDTPLTGPGVAQAYILRAAAIALANFQARYQDAGTAEPVNTIAHPQRWLELPDL